MNPVSMLRAVACATVMFSATTSFAAIIEVTTPAGVFTNPGPTNMNGPEGPSLDQWFRTNVRQGGAVGITSTYPRNGDGSAQFTGPTGAKADFEYYFSTPFALSEITSLSYEYYRSSTSTASDHLHPSLRLVVSNGVSTGYLVYEGIYNGQPTTPEDVWISADLSVANLWSTGTLPGAFADYDNSIADWVAEVAGLQVLGLSTGIGSGWDGSFDGAVDTITLTTSTGRDVTWNFNVSAANTAVPEPATLALLGAGLFGAAMLRRRRHPS